MQTFADLFKRYRLRAEFETLCQFGKALAAEGRIYDDSIFTHWQSGKRIPRDRTLLLAILKIFIQRRGITSPDEANEFLASAGFGYLTKEENQTVKSSLLDLKRNFSLSNNNTKR